jgi:urease accessory protein
MFDVAATLAVLHYGDSAYPAGGFAFSWGVEGLAADGLLAGADDLDRVIREHLRLRWQTMDRPLLGQAFRAPDVAALAAVDHATERATLSAAMRDGSRRAGRALLGVSARLGGTLSSAYRADLHEDLRRGHLPVVQAIVYRDARLGIRAAELVSGWSLVNGLVSAAVRLGVVGHIEGQRALGTARPLLAALLADDVAENALPSSFTPLIDIAVARARARPTRMFTT